jgi:hypothetical protein
MVNFQGSRKIAWALFSAIFLFLASPFTWIAKALVDVADACNRRAGL